MGLRDVKDGGSAFINSKHLRRDGRIVLKAHRLSHHSTVDSCITQLWTESDWYSIAERPAPAPRLANPEGCAALRILLITVPRVSRSCEHLRTDVSISPQEALRGGIPCSFLEPFARSWSHFVGICRQKLSKSWKIDVWLRVRRALGGSSTAVEQIWHNAGSQGHTLASL